MSTTWVTRCPQCATAFRLNLQQLTAAAGSVRCGACLKVFKAQEHLIKGSAPLPEALQPKKTPCQPPAEPIESAEPKEPNTSRETKTSSENAIEASSQAKEGQQASTENQAEPEFSDAFQNLNENQDNQDHFNSLQQQNQVTDGADESWAEAMLAELEQETPQGNSQPDSTKSTQKATPKQEPRVTPAPPATKGTEETASSATRPTPVEDSPVQQQQLQQQWLQDIEPEPIDLQPEPGRKIGNIIAWSVLNLLVAAFLFAQYCYFNFDRLARDERWRPGFATACNLLGCELPGIVDLAQIKSGNLVVRSHERYENALTVDAVIYNTAAHAQPFPNIELLFSDLNNEPVASRIFTPREYLGGELAGEKLMPSNTPIYLALEILDPGKGALNYQLSFQPANRR